MRLYPTAALLACLLAPLANAQSLSAGVQTQNASSSGATTTGNMTSITSSAPGQRWDNAVFGTTATAPGANSSAFSTFNCGGIGGKSKTFWVWSDADSKMMVEKDCPIVRTASLNEQLAHEVRATNPVLAAKLDMGTVDMICHTAQGISLRKQGLCTPDDPQPITTSQPITQDDARASLDNLYSGS